MNRNRIIIGALLILIGVVLAAFGSHALADRVPDNVQASFDIGVRFLMYHGFAALIFGSGSLHNHAAVSGSFRIILSGAILFSGSIFATTFFKITNTMTPPLRWITPLGGTVMIFGWAVFLFLFVKKR